MNELSSINSMIRVNPNNKNSTLIKSVSTNQIIYQNGFLDQQVLDPKRLLQINVSNSQLNDRIQYIKQNGMQNNILRYQYGLSNKLVEKQPCFLPRININANQRKIDYENKLIVKRLIQYKDPKQIESYKKNMKKDVKKYLELRNKLQTFKSIKSYGSVNHRDSFQSILGQLNQSSALQQKNEILLRHEQERYQMEINALNKRKQNVKQDEEEF